MALETRPLHPSFGMEIVGIDVRRVDAAAFREIAAAFDDHSVLLFRGPSLTDAEQIAFSERFGPLEATIRTIAKQACDLPEISNLSNVAGWPARSRRARCCKSCSHLPDGSRTLASLSL